MKISSKHILVLLVLGLLLLACQNNLGEFSEISRETPKLSEESNDDWRNIETKLFSLSLPNSMQETVVKGFDSRIWQFENKDIILDIEFGMLNVKEFFDFDIERMEQLRKTQNFQKKWVEINGKNALLLTYKNALNKNLTNDGRIYVIAVYFPLPDKNGSYKLSFVIRGRSEKDYEIAQSIINTIKVSDIE